MAAGALMLPAAGAPEEAGLVPCPAL